MKRIATLLLAMLLLLPMTGCVPIALRPWYADSDLTFDPSLLGVWVDKEGKGKTEFARLGDHSYRITSTNDEGNPGIMNGYLFRLKGETFLEVTPAPTDDEGEAIVDWHLVLKVVQTKPLLLVTTWNFDWLKDYLKKNPKALKHEWISYSRETGKSEIDSRDDLIVTASTEELREFLMAHSGDSKAFPPPGPAEGMIHKSPTP
jgi:hypothetical protein